MRRPPYDATMQLEVAGADEALYHRVAELLDPSLSLTRRTSRTADGKRLMVGVGLRRFSYPSSGGPTRGWSSPTVPLRLGLDRGPLSVGRNRSLWPKARPLI